MNLTKHKDGYYIPSYPRDWELSKKIKIGDEVRAAKDRNPKFHRKFFALLNLGYTNQDKYIDFEIYRMVMTMKAGFVVFVEGTDGKQHPLPRSVAFEKMDDFEFEKLFTAVREIISKDIGITGSQAEAELAGFY